MDHVTRCGTPRLPPGHAAAHDRLRHFSNKLLNPAHPAYLWMNALLSCIHPPACFYNAAMAIHDLRQHYDLHPPLEADHLAADPVDQFLFWFDEAGQAGIREPNAFTLATISADGRPRARTVLLKGVDPPASTHAADGLAPAAPRGFVFYTNYDSDKGRDLEAHPLAAMNFHWEVQARCVRIEGPITKVGPEETQAYFHSRPRASQLGAWCSRQSAVIADRATLGCRFAELEARYPEGTPIPVPPFWGGYRVMPLTIEFWQGQPSRLHDRLRYRRDDVRSPWILERLSP